LNKIIASKKEKAADDQLRCGLYWISARMRINSPDTATLSSAGWRTKPTELNY
jgi:hypothetical protein